jgi:4-amino-4-deoxy-L-arabinose transferase-like glycosyltransferase
MPAWGDETMCALNVVQRSYLGLLKPLDNTQVAPIGFLWAERLAYQSWGMSELAMRFFPLLAGIAALLLFAAWARLLAGPLAAVTAVGILATANFSVRYAVDMKPYGFDLLATMLLLLPATLFLLRRQNRWLLLLIALTPLASTLSYPVIFIAGGVAVGLAAEMPKLDRRQRLLAALWLLVQAVSFWQITWRVGHGQYQHDSAGMVAMWRDAFPPANPLRLLWYLILVHTGNMFEYPLGGNNGGSTLSFAVFLVGVSVWLKSRRGPILWLILTPFALNFAAAALRRYPYGDSARTEQPLSAAIILMIGVGTAALIERLAKSAEAQLLARRILFAVLLVLGAGVMINATIHPYFTPGYAELRRTVRGFDQEAGSDSAIVVLQRQAEVHSTVQWYLIEHKRPIVWNASENPAWQNDSGPVWVISVTPIPGLQTALEEKLGRKAIAHQSRYIQVGLTQKKIYWEVIGFGRRTSG